MKAGGPTPKASPAAAAPRGIVPAIVPLAGVDVSDLAATKSRRESGGGSVGSG